MHISITRRGGRDDFSLTLMKSDGRLWAVGCEQVQRAEQRECLGVGASVLCMYECQWGLVGGRSWNYWILSPAYCSYGPGWHKHPESPLEQGSDPHHADWVAN